MSLEIVSAYSSRGACSLKEMEKKHDFYLSPGYMKMGYNTEFPCSVRNEFEFIFGSGNVCLSKHQMECCMIEETGVDCYKTDEQIAGGKRFLSILERRRLAKKTEEKVECEWKTTKPDEETVKSQVSDLISRLKTQFREERLSRNKPMRNTSDYARHVWNNSVDSFLRHHEKPKIDIQYSESSSKTSVDGVYTFAIRPSRIRKRETQEKRHFGTVLQNTIKDTTQCEVFKNTNGSMSEEIKSHTATEKPKDTTPNNKETINADVNRHEKIFSHKTSMILDKFYHQTVTMLSKENALENVTGQAVRQNFEITPPCNDRAKNLSTMHSVKRFHKYLGHTRMVTKASSSAKYDNAIRQNCNAIVSGIFNVYPHLTLSFFAHTLVKIDGHLVHLDYIDKVLASDSTVPSYCWLLKYTKHNQRTLNSAGKHENSTEHTAVEKHRPDEVSEEKLHVSPLEKDPTSIGVSSAEQHASDEKTIANADTVSYENMPFASDHTDLSKACPEELIYKEITAHVDAHNNGEPQLGDVIGTYPLTEESMTTSSGILIKPVQNNENVPKNITELIVDESDDDSPFGIMSIFCGSEIHAWYTEVLKTER